jgi:MOSC domain-containing protein YiiM
VRGPPARATRALGGRGGICANVVRPGTVSPDDAVRVEEPDPWTVGRATAGRRRESDAGSE